MNDKDTKPLIEQLNNKSSAKRRSAAKKLRVLRDKEAGPALLAALKSELKDKRTWETQYQIIMALGESGHAESLDFLVQLTEQKFDATMIYVALGDTIIKLENDICSTQAMETLTTWLDKKQTKLLQGALRALAMLHLVPSNRLVQKIILYVSQPKNEELQFWTAAAAPGWPTYLTEAFLEKATRSARLEDTKKAAKAALKGKYLNWNPL